MLNVRGFFSDMDKTLVFSNRSAEFHKFDIEENVLVAERYKNEPSGFIPLRAVETLANWAQDNSFIPVTTRSVEQFSRLTWVNKVWERTSYDNRYALVANGGILLDHGEVVPEYSKMIKDSIERPLESVKEKLNDIYRRVESIERLLYVDDLFALFLIHPKAFSDRMLESITQEFAEIGWVASLQGKKLYLIPESVSKERGAKYVMDHLLSEWKVAAAGDSLLDAGMLEIADYAFRPPHGELESAGYTFTSDVVRLPNSGIQAAQDLIDELIKLG